VIEMLQKAEDSKTAVVSFRWQGMTIFVVATLDRDGAKSLTVTGECVGNARLSLTGRKAKWTMRKAATDLKDAGVCTISDGDVEDAMKPSTGER
jgi:hypothetical protein